MCNIIRNNKPHIFRICIYIFLFSLVLTGCLQQQIIEEPIKLQTNANFALHVTNQSFTNSNIDISVEIDGNLLISEHFKVGDQHRYKTFWIALESGEHQLRVWSNKGDATLDMNFTVQDEDNAVLAYWYSPRPKYGNPRPESFSFKLRKGPLIIM